MSLTKDIKNVLSFKPPKIHSMTEMEQKICSSCTETWGNLVSVEDVVMTTTSADTNRTIESSDSNDYIYVKNIPLNDLACNFFRFQ